MKAMKRCVTLLLSLLLAASCDDDNNDEVSAPITGIWSGNQAEFRINPDGIIPAFTKREDDLQIQLEFRNDGVMVLTDKSNQTATGTYAFEGRSLTVNIDYDLELISMGGTYNVEELTTSRLRVSIEKEGAYEHPDTGQRFDGKVKATLYLDRQTDQ